MLTQKHFSHTKTLQAPLAAVWEIISRASGVNEWIPFIVNCRLEGEGENARRFCETVDGNQLKETILRIDATQHEFEYSIDEQDMMPIENYLGKYKLKELGNKLTEITWSSSFDIREEDFPTIKEGLKGMYEMGLEGLEQLAGQSVV